MVPKFRAFLTETKTMHDVLQIDLSRSMVSLKIENASEWYWFKEVVLMQSTGLKDLKGVEIFEGFAVYHEEGEFSYKGIVRKDKYYFYIEGIGINDSFSFDDVSDTRTGEADLVVIGNIYENPEILEQASEI